MQPASAFSSVVLPALVPPATSTLAPPATAPQPRAALAVEAELLERDRTRREAPDRDDGPVGRERRKHRVKPRAVGQAGVDDRRGAVEAQPERRDHVLRDRLDLVAPTGRAATTLEPAGALDVRRGPGRSASAR